jgi:UDP-glucose 4-epimerase
MKVLIFGITGNCGKYCAKRFIQDGHTVFGVGRSSLGFSSEKLTFIKGDITDKTLFDKLPIDFDLVVNFAGVQPSILPTSENTDMKRTLSSYVDININGVFNILEYLRNSNIRTYIYSTSHRDIELSWKQGEFLKNDEPFNINYSGDHTMYAISKTTGKMMGDYYGKAFGFRTFNLRLPMMFLVPNSPYYLKDGKKEIMPFLQIIKKVISNENLEIWGDKNLKRDYVHVENLYSLINLSYLSDLSQGTFAVGTGEAVTTEAFVKSIAQEFSPDTDFDFIYKPNNKTYKFATYDISEQVEKLGYKPILLKEMLRMLHTQIDSENCLKKWGWVK